MNQDRVRDWLFDAEALRRYILCCCQAKLGGIKDKPDKSPDLYHTAYALSGLAFTEHRPVPTPLYTTPLCSNNAVFNVTDTKVARALEYFSQHPFR